jgi:hypothetical protein
MATKKLCANRAVITQFICEITTDWVENFNQVGIFEILCLGENRKPIVERFTLADINKAADLALIMNEAKLNVYITINPINPDAIIKASSSATDKDIIRAHYSFADADNQEGLDGLIALSNMQLPDITVTTGTVPHERRHAYWQLAEPCLNLKLWQSKQVQIADQCKTDGSVSNPSRIMRLPGTVSYPSTAKQGKGYVPELVTMKVGKN